MIRKWILLSVFPLLLTIYTPAIADEQVTKVGKGDTYMVVDEENDAIVFVIKGEKKALLDEQGLQVRDNIRYGGTIVDIGRKAAGSFADVAKKPAGETE